MLALGAMIELAQFANRRDAQIFADYCQAQGWLVKVTALDSERTTLYVSAPFILQVQEQLRHFQQHPTDSRYQAAAWQLSVPKDFQHPTNAQPFWRRLWLATGPFTLLISVLCLILYFLQQLFPEVVITALLAPTVISSDWLSLRWLTPAFLHFSVEHLAFNLLAWLIYAGRMERQLGSRFLLGFLLVTAVASNLLQWLATGPNFGGLSGVCFALFGFAWVYGMRYPKQVLRAERSDFVVSLIFLGLGFADLLWVNTANYAHLGGLIVGLLLALLPFKPAKPIAS